MFSIAHPIACAVAVVLAIIGVLRLRRAPLSKPVRFAWQFTGVSLALAAAGLSVPLPSGGSIYVMVDVSPSTRTALYRDRASLDLRLGQLLPNTSFKLLAFSDHSQPLAEGERIAEQSCDRTVFAPPADARAILLLSDGRFESPRHLTSPIFPVIDAGLVNPPDARIDTAAALAGRAVVAVTNTQETARPLSLDGLPAGDIAAGGSASRSLPIDLARAAHRVSITSADAWPENDAMNFTQSIGTPRPRWWIGDSAPPGWRHFAPGAVPTDPAAWLDPSAIVLADVPADAISPAATVAMARYVRLFGGTLLIAGGPHAFAAGGYSGTAIDDLSPLSSDPPTPTQRWLLLTDASGSMASPAAAGAADGAMRWAIAQNVIADVLHRLPANDMARVGSFAADLQWWSDPLRAADAAAHPPTPPLSLPSGPTNLQAALDAMVKGFATAAASPTQVLLLTDGEASLDQPDDLARRFVEAHAQLNLLAIGQGAALPTLRQIVASTGGHAIAETNAGRWIAAARELLKSTRPNEFVQRVKVASISPSIGGLSVSPPSKANQTWMKLAATELAAGTIPAQQTARATAVPLIAQQSVGSGTVIAQAFDDLATSASLADHFAALPHDPGYVVDWQKVGDGEVSLSASDEHGRNLNALAFTLSVTNPAGEEQALPFTQTAPGRYSAALPTSAEARLVRVRLEGRELDRLTAPGKYPPEFAAIGVNLPALQTIADASGGKVVPPTDVLPISVPRRWRAVDCTTAFSILAAMAAASALVLWKRAG